LSSRAEQKEKRRQEILKAGLDLFIRKGYTDTKITDIAGQVGMSTGLLFHYFDSKEKLYEALIRIGVSGPQSVIPGVTADPIAYFEKVADQIFYAIKNEPLNAKMFILMRQAVQNEAAPTDVRELLTQVDIITPCIALIEAGQRSGCIRPGNPRALSITFWRTIQGIAEEIAIQPDTPCPEAEWIVDMLRRKPE